VPPQADGLERVCQPFNDIAGLQVSVSVGREPPGDQVAAKRVIKRLGKFVTSNVTNCSTNGKAAPVHGEANHEFKNLHQMSARRLASKASDDTSMSQMGHFEPKSKAASLPVYWTGPT
jgi:hypothetical protein